MNVNWFQTKQSSEKGYPASSHLRPRQKRQVLERFHQDYLANELPVLKQCTRSIVTSSMRKAFQLCEQLLLSKQHVEYTVWLRVQIGWENPYSLRII